MQISQIDTMGGREVNDIYLTDCCVSDDRLVGVEGQGWAQLIAGLNIERVIIGALYLGLAQRAFDDTLRYVKERKQFGKPIGSFQALSQRLADLATELEATRLLVRNTAELVDENPEQLLPREASMCKLKATELAKKAALEGMQMMGGMGYAVNPGWRNWSAARSSAPSSEVPARFSATSSPRRWVYSGVRAWLP